MANNFIKHYLLSDEEVANLTTRFGQFIMTKSGSMYIDTDDNTRVQLGGGGAGGNDEPAQKIYIENTTTNTTAPFTKIIATTAELVDGESSLEDGVLYLVYEAD